MKRKFLEKAMEIIFFISACASIVSVILISFFMFSNGLPAIAEIGVLDFLLGKEWSPVNTPPSFGIFPMILGSLYITFGAVILGVPVGILTAIFLSKFCPKKYYRFLKPALNLMAGIPSIIYGFFGLVVLVPLSQQMFGGTGYSILTASVLLGIMILPTVIGLSEAAIRSVPESYYEGAVALGATHERSVIFAMVPAAKSGIISSVVLGIGRAIGETMAVVMVAGNQARMPNGIFKGIRTLTANIVIEMGYAADLHREALIGTGVILFIFILLINALFLIFKRKVI